MQCKKHKRKTKHVVIVTSDAVNDNATQFRIRPKVLKILVIVLCMIIGAMIGYIIYEEKLWETAVQKTISQSKTIEQLMQENEILLSEKEEKEAELNAEIKNLNERIQILSETVNEKVAIEKELTKQLEQQSLPQEFPLTGSAFMEETTDSGNPICIFTASEGITVVATAKGTVTAVNEDAEYGHIIWIDHGNGYVTIYRNKGEASVKQGDSVVQGSTLFTIDKDNEILGYQMMKDGTYISPMEMLLISG